MTRFQPIQCCVMKYKFAFTVQQMKLVSIKGRLWSYSKLNPKKVGATDRLRTKTPNAGSIPSIYCFVIYTHTFDTFETLTHAVVATLYCTHGGHGALFETLHRVLCSKPPPIETEFSHCMNHRWF